MRREQNIRRSRSDVYTRWQGFACAFNTTQPLENQMGSSTGLKNSLLELGRKKRVEVDTFGGYVWWTLFSDCFIARETSSTTS